MPHGQRVYKNQFLSDDLEFAITFFQQRIWRVYGYGLSSDHTFPRIAGIRNSGSSHDWYPGYNNFKCTNNVYKKSRQQYFAHIKLVLLLQKELKFIIFSFYLIGSRPVSRRFEQSDPVRKVRDPQHRKSGQKNCTFRARGRDKSHNIRVLVHWTSTPPPSMQNRQFWTRLSLLRHELKLSALALGRSKSEEMYQPLFFFFFIVSTVFFIVYSIFSMHVVSHPPPKLNKN